MSTVGFHFLPERTQFWWEELPHGLNASWDVFDQGGQLSARLASVVAGPLGTWTNSI
jgi:hypothetical protein